MKIITAVWAVLLVLFAVSVNAGVPQTIDLDALCGIAEGLHLVDSIAFDDGVKPTARGWSLYGDDGVIVDLDAGNKGITQTSADNYWDQWLKSYQFSRCAITARLRVDAENSSANFMQLCAKGTGPHIGLGIRSHRFCAVNYKNNSVIQDLGAVAIGEFIDAGLYVDKWTNTVGYWIGAQNGTSVINTLGMASGAYAEFGAATYDAPTGTSTMTYDWVGVYVPEPSSMMLLLGMSGVFAIMRRKVR